jgi:hypothetical protein
MANQQGNGRGTGRDDDDRYRSRDDDDRGYGSHWEDRDRDDRWAGRTGSSAWGSERFGQREYGRGGWSQQGYGYNDSDRPSFERGTAGARTQEPSTWERAGRSGLYGGGGGYEPGPGSRSQNRYGSQGYESSGYRQHHNGFTAHGFDQRRGPHRGKGPQGFVRSDERVRELVCEALTDDDEVDATHIEVSVKNGEVMLAGTVDDREQKRLAEDCVERVRGVRDVHNQLRIRS